MMSSLSFLYLRSCEGVSAPLLSLSAMSWSCRRRSRLYSLAMLSKVSTTLGLSSASMAASESEFFISSSSKSPSPGAGSPPSPSSPLARSGAPLNGAAPASAPAPGSQERAARRARRHDRLAVGADHRRRHRFGVGPGIGRFEVDDVAQEHLSLVELVAPNDDGLEGERALAQPGDHRFAAGLDALGDGDLALAREQLHRAHFAQIHAHRIIRALGRLLGLGLGRDLLLDLDQLAALALGLLVGLLARLLAPFARLLGLDHVDAHLAEHGEHVLDLLGIDLLRGQHRVDLAMGHVAALLGGADELLDRGIGEVEQRAVRRALGCLLLRQVFLVRRSLGIACHKPPQPALSQRRAAVLPRSRYPKGMATPI